MFADFMFFCNHHIPCSKKDDSSSSSSSGTTTTTSDVRKQILQNTLTDKLKKYFCYNLSGDNSISLVGSTCKPTMSYFNTENSFYNKI